MPVPAHPDPRRPARLAGRILPGILFAAGATALIVLPLSQGPFLAMQTDYPRDTLIAGTVVTFLWFLALWLMTARLVRIARRSPARRAAGLGFSLGLLLILGVALARMLTGSGLTGVVIGGPAALALVLVGERLFLDHKTY